MGGVCICVAMLFGLLLLTRCLLRYPIMPLTTSHALTGVHDPTTGFLASHRNVFPPCLFVHPSQCVF